MFTRLSMPIFLLLASVAPNALATATYSYTSIQPMNIVSGFYQPSGTVSVSITLPTALPADTTSAVDSLVVAFSFSDGQQTLTEANAFMPKGGCTFTTDAAGRIVQWFCQAIGNDALGAQIGHSISLVQTGLFSGPAIFEAGAQNLPCNAVYDNFCGFNSPGALGGVADSAATGLGPVVAFAPWKVSITTPVPTMGFLSLALLALIAALLGTWAAGAARPAKTGR